MCRFETRSSSVPSGQPGRRDVHVHPAEVQTIAPEIAVARHRDLVARELTVLDRPDEHVEVSVRLRGHVGEARPVRREDRVHVDLRVGRERAAFAGRDVHDLQLDRGAAIVGDVGNPAPVGRPVGHRVILAVVGELARAARGAVDDPDRTAHRDRQRRAVRRPRGSPWGRAGRRREVVVVHVVPALLRGGIRDRALSGQVGADEDQARGQDDQSAEHVSGSGLGGRLVMRRQTTAVQVHFVVLFEIVHAVGGHHET